MGNIGRSSTGCGLCRKRKIKCDEGKPGCRRCAQMKKPCPGYPFQVQLDIRLDTPPAFISPPIKPESLVAWYPQLQQSQSVSPPVRAHSALLYIPQDYDQHELKHEDVQEKSLLQLTPEHLPQSPPRYDIQHQSICFFLHLFCYQANRLYSFPVIDFLPEVLLKSRPGSPIQLAAAAVSRMTLADQYSGKDIRLATGKEYGEALSMTTKTIQNPTENTKDETVVAVWLLGLYEHINTMLNHGRFNGEGKSAEEEYQSHISHIRGAMHLLRLRGQSQFDSARSEKIFRVLKAAIQMRLFMLNSVTSKDFGDMELDIYQDEHEFVPSKTANKASTYFLKIARLTERIKSFLFTKRSPDNKVELSLEAQSLIECGECLDKGMDEWSVNESGWQMMKIVGETKGTTWALYPSHALYYFYSFWVYLYWIRFLIARVKLYEALIEIVRSELWYSNGDEHKAQKHKTEYQISSYQTNIQLNAREVIGLTAYALGDVTPTGHFNSAASGRNPGKVFQEINVIAAMQLVIPLKSLQRSEFPTAQQKGAIDLAISHIADGFRRQPLICG